jgi:hypothetical protein
MRAKIFEGLWWAFLFFFFSFFFFTSRDGSVKVQRLLMGLSSTHPSRLDALFGGAVACVRMSVRTGVIACTAKLVCYIYTKKSHGNAASCWKASSHTRPYSIVKCFNDPCLACVIQTRSTQRGLLRSWTIDVKTEKSWRGKRRYWCH